MSTSRTDYVIFGVDVGYDNVDYDTFEAEINSAPGAKFNIIYDSMSGKYAYAGYVLAQGDEYEGFGDGVVIQQKHKGDVGDAIDEVLEKFPNLNLTVNDFKLVAVSHFS